MRCAGVGFLTHLSICNRGSLDMSRVIRCLANESLSRSRVMDVWQMRKIQKQDILACEVLEEYNTLSICILYKVECECFYKKVYHGLDCAWTKL